MSEPERPADHRRAAIEPTEVAPGIFVGGTREATGFAGARICVRDERPPDLDPTAMHLPIYDAGAEVPLRAALDRVADRIRASHQRGERVVVYCGHGVRRGPLAVAWYFHRYEGLALGAAYDRIARLRPQIERPEEWIRGWDRWRSGPGADRRPAGESDA